MQENVVVVEQNIVRIFAADILGFNFACWLVEISAQMQTIIVFNKCYGKHACFYSPQI